MRVRRSIARLTAIGPASQQRRSRQRQVFTAGLIYDTQAQHLPRGVRTLRSRKRRLLFAAGDDGAVGAYEVMLEVMRDVATGAFWVTGEVLANGSPVRAGVVVQTGETSVQTDTAGSFTVLHTPLTACRLLLTADDWELTLPSFELMNPTLRSR